MVSSSKGLLDVDLVFFGGELDEAQEVGGAAAGAHGSVEQRLGPVGDGLGGVEVVDAAEAVALGAGAVVGVEGEAAGLEAGDVDAAVGAGHGGGVEGLVLPRVAGPCMPMRTRPLAICRALRTEVSRRRVSYLGAALASAAVVLSGGSGLRMMRSTMASMVWFLRFSRRMPSVSSVISPSMRARKPCWSRASSSSRNSPLRPRTMGA